MRDKGSPEEHEHRRLLAVQRVLEGYTAEEVAEFLGVDPGRSVVGSPRIVKAEDRVYSPGPSRAARPS